MTTVIGAIAGISLLVGGIGVMNIMLDTCHRADERIWSSQSIGATRGGILVQFWLSRWFWPSLEGLVDLDFAYGVISDYPLAAASLEGPPIISLNVAIGGIIFSAFVGIIFGIYSE